MNPNSQLEKDHEANIQALADFKEKQKAKEEARVKLLQSIYKISQDKSVEIKLKARSKSLYLLEVRKLSVSD